MTDFAKTLGLAETVVRRNPLFYPAAESAFARLSTSSLEERRAFTEQRLQAVLKAASKTRYGSRIEQPDAFSGWPILDKQAVQNDPSAFVRRPAFSIRASTGGTTGAPLPLYRSLGSVSTEQAAIDHVVSLAGLDLRHARTAVLRADSVPRSEHGGAQIYWADNPGTRRRVFSARDLSAATLHRFSEGLSTFRPDCLFAYPSALESLCLLLRQQSARLAIPVTVTSSEVLSREARALAEDVLSTRVVDLYGQAERVALSYGLEPQEHYFLTGYGKVELLPTEHSAGHIFEIVATSLSNVAMPLVRYRTGDLVELGTTQSEACERVCYGLEPFQQILGRTSDYLIAPDGARLIGMNHIPRGVQNIFRLQIIQEQRDFVRVLVLARESFGNDDRDVIARNLEAKLKPGMTYDIRTVERLVTVDNGRVPFLIRGRSLVP